MNCRVKVHGIPSNLQMRRLIPLFSDVLSMRSNEFLMRMLPSRGPVKDVLLSLPSYPEAELAQEKLDNFVYKHNSMTYVLTATMDTDYHKQNNKRSRQKYRNYRQHFVKSSDQEHGDWREEWTGRDRSRSPHYENESFRLDMQIEILRKQRMIIEEERKLLEEQRKLDQLKMQSFNNDIPSISNRIYDDNQMSETSPNQSEKNLEPKQPRFYQASGVLLREMYIFINKYSAPEERMTVLSHLRSILLQRMARVVAADGNGVLKTQKVIVLYRTEHPTTEDEELVKQAIDDVRQGRFTDDTVVATVVKKPTESVNTEVESDTIKSSADEKTLQEKATNMDTANSGGATNISDTSIFKKQFEQKRLHFHKSSGVLIKKMNLYMDLHCPPDKRKFLVEYLRYTLKQRLGAVVDGQPIYQTHKIIKLYRMQYPDTADEDLVKQLVEDIEEDRVPDDVFTKDKNINVSTEEKTADVDDATEDSKTTAENKDAATDRGQQKKNANVKNIVKEQSNEEKIIDTIDDDSQKNMDSVDTDKDIADPTTKVENSNEEDNQCDENEIVSNKCAITHSNYSVNNKDIAEPTTKVENSNEKEENQCNENDIVSNKSDITNSNLANDCKLDDENKDNLVNTETTQNNENNNGIKRKNEDVDDHHVKVPKADNGDEIDANNKLIENVQD